MPISSSLSFLIHPPIQHFFPQRNEETPFSLLLEELKITTFHLKRVKVVSPLQRVMNSQFDHKNLSHIYLVIIPCQAPCTNFCSTWAPQKAQQQTAGKRQFFFLFIQKLKAIPIERNPKKLVSPMYHVKEYWIAWFSITLPLRRVHQSLLNFHQSLPSQHYHP